MQILWKTKRPMQATEIWEAVQQTNLKDKEITVFAIQRVLKLLLDDELIVVSNFVRVGKTTAREYEASITAEDYAVMQYKRNFPKQKGTSLPKMVAALLDRSDHEKSELDALEVMLEERRQKLEADDKRE